MRKTLCVDVEAILRSQESSESLLLLTNGVSPCLGRGPFDLPVKVVSRITLGTEYKGQLDPETLSLLRY